MYLSNGNPKVGKIPTFNIPSKLTCIGCTAECLKHCYAKKAEQRWTQVMPSRMANWAATESDWFVTEMVAEISRRKSEYIRIHESGDFYSQAYLNKWIQIATAIPTKKFLAFTKSYQLDFSQVPKNLKLIYSVMPDTKFMAAGIKSRAYAGDCKTGGERVLECFGKCDVCGMCWGIPDDMSVHFKMH